MTETLWQRLDHAARNLTPFALTLTLIVLGLVPLRLPFLPPLGHSLVLISIYYWTIHRPATMPVGAVFFVGVVADLVGGSPLVGPLVLVAVFAVVHAVRRWLVGASPLVVWAGFVTVAFDAVLLTWLLTWYVAGQMPRLGPGLSGALLGAAAYPLAAALFSRVQRTVMR